MKVVFDTNVLISAFVFKGFSQQVFRYCVENETLILSPFILSELKEKLQGKFKFSKEEVGLVIELIEEKATVIKPGTKLPDVCRDKDDNYVLQTAESGQVDYLVTGDKDLLVLTPFKHIPILTPREFFDQVIPKQ